LWREEVTERSWRLLQRLRSEFPFTLIGGWAVYLYAHRLKSKDIDIVVGLDVLESLRTAYEMRKSVGLKKYEFTADGIDVDTYVPFYSNLGIPAEELLENSISVEGIRVPRVGHLLATKQRAEDDRRGTEKGLKDRVDILSLLLFSEVDLGSYARLLASHGLVGYLDELRKVVSEAKLEMAELGIHDHRKVKRVKKQLVSRIDEALKTI
jgi:hypothetical protein